MRASSRAALLLCLLAGCRGGGTGGPSVPSAPLSPTAPSTASLGATAQVAIVLSPARLAFEGFAGGPSPAPMTLEVAGGSPTVPTGVELRPAAPWLSVVPPKLVAPARATAAVHIEGLPPGSYSGAVEVFSSEGGRASAEVSLRVRPMPVVTLDPSQVGFEMALGETPPERSLSLGIRVGSDSEAPRGTSWSASASEEWIHVTPASGTGPAEITLRPVPGRLPPGSYRGSLSVRLEGAPTRAESLVALDLSPRPMAGIEPRGVTLAGALEALGEVKGRVHLANEGGGRLRFKTAKVPPWLSVSPTAGSAPADLELSMAPSVSKAGSLDGTLLLEFPGAATERIPLAVHVRICPCWVERDAGVDAAYHWTLAVNPKAPSTVFVGTHGSGIYRSTDGGVHWASASTGLTSTAAAQTVYALAVNPSRPELVLAGTGDGVYRSVNGGDSWKASSEGMTEEEASGGGSHAVYALAVHPKDPDLVLAGTSSGLLFRSTDGGEEWSRIEGAPWVGGVYQIAFHPKKKGVVYLAVGGGAQPGREEAEGGEESSPSGGPGSTGVFRSTDGGKTWKAPSRALRDEDVGSLALSPDAPYALYAGTFKHGVFLSNDGGDSWKPARSGLTNPDIRALWVGGGSGKKSTVMAGTWGAGVWISTDGGGSWRLYGAGMEDAAVTAIAGTAGEGAALYASTFGRGILRLLARP